MQRAILIHDEFGIELEQPLFHSLDRSICASSARTSKETSGGSTKL